MKPLRDMVLVRPGYRINYKYIYSFSLIGNFIGKTLDLPKQYSYLKLWQINKTGQQVIYEYESNVSLTEQEQQSICQYIRFMLEN